MRSLSLLLGLNVLWLVAADVCGQGRIDIRVRGKAKALAAPAAPEGFLMQEEVKGWGATQEDAEKDALEKARVLVENYLKRANPPLRWKPSAAFVHQHLLVGEPRRCEEEDQKIELKGRVVTVQCWVWTVGVTPDQSRLISREEREQRAQVQRQERVVRSEGRMVLLGKVTGGLVLLLAAVAGFLHLDEKIKGSRRVWMKAGLAAALIGAGAGLVLFA
jgi:hypothetical protein